MKDSLLLRIALVTSIIGLGVMILVLSSYELEDVNISEARKMQENEAVRLTGRVDSVSASDDFTVITIEKKELIKVVVFKGVNLSTGEQVVIEGELKDYQGEKEIVADSIVIV